MRYVRVPNATIVFDYLWTTGDTEPDEVGKSWNLLEDPCEVVQVVGHAYDDDGEHYYKLHLSLPTEDPDQEDALCRLLNILERHAGVVRIDFPGRPELNVG